MKFDTTTLPSKETVKAAREAAGLTQEQASELVHRAGRKRWSEWETGERQIQLDTWELFCLKAGLPIKKPKGASACPPSVKT